MQAQNSSGGRNGRWRECPACESRRSAPGSTRASCKVAASSRCLGRDVRPGGGWSEIHFGEGPEIRIRSHTGGASHRVQELIARAEKRVAALDAQRAQEVASLAEGRARLIRLESAALEAPQVAMPPPEASSEVLQLRELVSQLQAQIRGPDHQDAPCMPTVKRLCRSGQGSGPVLVMPRYIPAELSAWMGERQADLHDGRIHFIQNTFIQF